MTRAPRVAIVGGGPAGLMAAESARDAGAEVDVYERLGSVGRKFLVAGKGGLNLTHSENFDAFVGRYGARRGEIARWLRTFDAERVREWARGLGVETFVGTSGRVFPNDLKAAPLLRAWVRRLRAHGVRFHMHHRWIGWNESGALRFEHDDKLLDVAADATVLALGGASWPVLGSDGAWVPLLETTGVHVEALKPSNCGFDVAWSAYLAAHHAGEPVKPVVIQWRDARGAVAIRQGEFVVTTYGVEGSLIYALSTELRETIAAQGAAQVHLDLAPTHEHARLVRELSRPSEGRSISELLRRRAGIEGVKAGLLREALDKDAFQDPLRVAGAIKSLPLTLLRARPLEEAISTAGGVRFESLDDGLMLKPRAGMFCAGEMIDWEAPTGGYLLTACLASGRIAGDAAAKWATRFASPASGSGRPKGG
ncbi:MAG: TIGR03862 family flavoprotein [Rhodanobacteraceae bacterium]